MNSPRVTAFLHVPFEGLGLIERALAEAGITVRCCELSRMGAQVPDVSEESGLIFMGGPQSANDPLPYLAAEMEIIARAAVQNTPVLGVCLGSQLIARALGARVYRNAVKEIGWFPVEWTANTASDPLFRDLTEPEVVFHWHGETFDLPEGAVWLARSEACRHQAFRYGNNVWALQFHLEVTPAIVSCWCQEDANAADVRELSGPVDPYANTARLEQLSALVFGRWARLVRGD